MKKDSLGDRIKNYEQICQNNLMPHLPIIARLDGKAFHIFTKGLKKPYDIRLSQLMQATTKFAVKKTQANIGYTQSDEITLVWYQKNIHSEIFMGGKGYKLNSIVPAMVSLFFNNNLAEYIFEKASKNPIFDCRVFNVPNKTEVINTLIWREKDAIRNSIQALGQTHFSHNALLHKSCKEIKEKILNETGVNWEEYPVFFKRGSYVIRKKEIRKFTIDELARLPEKHEAHKNTNLEVERNIIKLVELPELTKIKNKIGVFFRGEAPITEEKEVSFKNK